MTGATLSEAADTPAPRAAQAAPHAAQTAQPPRLRLLGGFELLVGGAPAELPASAQRLVAFLAIRGRPLQRLHVAGCLWSDVPEERANAALRTALWRSRRGGCQLVEARGARLALARAVEVDLRAATDHAQLLLTAPAEETLAIAGLDHVWADSELLPDWYDEWVLIERERHRSLRLHALETLCAALTGAGRYGEAAEAAIAAVSAEPLRESAQRALIAVHLAEGNTCEALRQYRLFAALLRDQLGLAPSPRLRAQLAAVVPSVGP